MNVRRAEMCRGGKNSPSSKILSAAIIVWFYKSKRGSIINLVDRMSNRLLDSIRFHIEKQVAELFFCSWKLSRIQVQKLPNPKIEALNSLYYPQQWLMQIA